MKNRLADAALICIMAGVALFWGLVLYLSVPMLIALWATGWDARIALVALGLIFGGVLLAIFCMAPVVPRPVTHWPPYPETPRDPWWRKADI